MAVGMEVGKAVPSEVQPRLAYQRWYTTFACLPRRGVQQQKHALMYFATVLVEVIHECISELSTACQEQPAEEDGSDQESCLNFSVHV